MRRSAFSPVPWGLFMAMLCVFPPCGGIGRILAQNPIRQGGDPLEQSGIQGGFVVHVGCGDGSLTAALRKNDSYQVQGLDRDPANVAAARETIRRAGDYGPVAVDQWTTPHLPYVDNLVNLLVVGRGNSVSEAEIQRVLVPRGVAMIQQDSGDWKRIEKPWPETIDEWSHFFHDPSGNTVAHDQEVGPPRHLQWVGSPRWSRHHDRMASMSALVSTAGRMFYIMDEGSRISIQLPPHWKLIARDAFNGTVLWKRDIPDWQNHLWPLKSGPTQLARRLVSAETEVYATLGIKAPVSALHAATGETVRTYADSDGAEEIIHDGGILYLVVNKGERELDVYRPLHGTVGDQKQVNDDFSWNEEPRIVMAYDAKSGDRLWARTSRVAPLTLATDADRVYFHDGERLQAIEKKSGGAAWQTEPLSRRRNVTFNFGPRLVTYDGVVLFAGGDNRMTAFAAGDGKQLWTAEHPNSGYQSPQDLMVVDGLVWCAPTTSGRDTGVFTGRDPRTGEVKKSFPPDVNTYWFHHRCYISKATDNFLIPSRTGIEFVDVDQEHWDIHHWVRGGCLYGVMPCNGLTYAPPHDCACYPEAKLYGINALAPRSPTRPVPTTVAEEGRLLPGPAYDVPLSAEGEHSDKDWPTYRKDNARSGATNQDVGAVLSEEWSVELTGPLTPPVIADGTVFVARTDAHTLYALEEATGRTKWTQTIGGRIDSPPTVAQGRVVFGGTDGYVYALNAADGRLAWRYRAAPEDRRLMSFEQLESVWPVHGSALVRGDVVHVVAGRSVFLDGGLRLLRLDLRTGRKLSETLMDDKNPETGNNLQEVLQVLQMPVGLPDILSSDEKHLYMRSQKFDFNGDRLKIGPNAADFVGQASVQRGEGAHMFAPMGFLDDTWFHRSYWVYGQSFAGGHGGYYQAGRFAPSGRIMVQGSGYVFGYGRKPEYLRWTTTLEHQLFAAPPEPPSVELPQPGAAAAADANVSVIQVKNSPSLNPTGKPITVEAWINTTSPNGVILARGGPAEGYALSVDKGKPQFHVRAKSNLATVTGPNRIVGGWHHVVGVLGADLSMTLYVDGESVASGKTSSLLTTDPKQAMEIGADLAGAVGDYQNENGFSGAVDEIRVYFAALGAEAVKARFRNNEDPDADAVLVLPFDDGQARDLSPFRNNGEVTAAQIVDGKFGKAARFTGAAPGPGRRANRNNNGPQKQTFVEHVWTQDIPIYVRGMTLCNRRLFVVGPEDVIDEEQTFDQLSRADKAVEPLLTRQDEILDGREGGWLLAVDADSGETTGKLKLDALPVWDGLAAAQGKLFLSTLDGRVRCYRGETPKP